jgi:molybdate/tungstate transport system permease protein
MKNKPLFINVVFIIALSIFGSLLLLFIILPLLSIIFNTSISDYILTLKDKEVVSSIFLTFKTGFISTLVGSLLGVPLAYLISRRLIPFERFISAIIDIPILVPHSAAGIALLTIFSRGSTIHKLLGIEFIGTEAGIVIGMMYVSLSFLVNSAKIGFSSYPKEYEEIAASLGHSSFSIFFKVSLPLAASAIKKGMIMMWARGISEFGAVIILTYNPQIAPVLIYTRYESFGLKYARPVAALLILITLGIFVILNSMKNGDHNA